MRMTLHLYGDINTEMNLFNHNNNNSADDYVQLKRCGCWIVSRAKPALNTILKTNEDNDENGRHHCPAGHFSTHLQHAMQRNVSQHWCGYDLHTINVDDHV